ncbi:MAG: SDR family oxidoreductase [Candidatus Eisenbacteria sp.]|nr:SDR family oxidoreductase [Candidatus Eisenbacteria bacterium]
MNSQQPVRVLVAGATGTLGRALIPVLSNRGREVVALARPASQGRLESLSGHIKEVVTAEVTEPDIPASIFEGVHSVISSIGITRQRDGLSYDDVDFGGNLNLLRAAEQSGVQRFVYVSVVGVDQEVNVPGLKAKRRFEEVLVDSTLEWQIVRPSGFFTDIADFLAMARRGTVHLFGNGRSRISPIHPTDLSEAIVDRLEAKPRTIVSVGGPADFTWDEIAELCCRVTGRRCRIRHWPESLLQLALAITRVLSRPTYGTLSFLVHVMTSDTTARNYGSRGLEAFLKAQQEADQQVHTD